MSVAVEIVGGVETRDEGYRFRFPFTLAPNYHSKAHAVTTPTGGKLQLPVNVFKIWCCRNGVRMLPGCTRLSSRCGWRRMER